MMDSQLSYSLYKGLAVARCARAEGGACRRLLQGLWTTHGQTPSPTMATIAYMSPRTLWPAESCVYFQVSASTQWTRAG